MASKYTKITRSINEFKNFLEHYQDIYLDAYKHIRGGMGWNLKYYEEETYKLSNNLYNYLYNDLYPKLFEDNPSTDEDILYQFESNLNFLEKSLELFQKIIDKSEEKVLYSADGILQDLVIKAIYKLREVLTLAREDLNFQVKLKKENFLIGIITSTPVEHQFVLDLLSDYKACLFDEADSNLYYEGFFEKNGKKIKIILTQTHHQGIAAASTTTTKLILKYNPEIIFMTGHQAGNKNLKNTHSLGHILIGEESVDYQQNEIIQKSDGKIDEKDRKLSIRIDSWLKSMLSQFSQKQILLDDIKELYNEKSIFPENLRAHIGKILSGSALLRASDKFETIITQNPGTVGLDMETFGFYYACENTRTKNHPKFVSIKSISDFGEQKLGSSLDKLQPHIRQNYACFTSANFVFEFIIDTFKDYSI